MLRVLFVWFDAVPADARRTSRRRWRGLLCGVTVMTHDLAPGRSAAAASARRPSAGPEPNQYWAALQPQLMRFSFDEQRVAVAIYRELAKGEPLDEMQLAQALGCSIADTRAWLERASIKRCIYADAQGRIAGFGGLAVTAMHHRFEVDGRELSTWCAWDSLFIPELLGRPARVTSTDPETGGVVRLVVTPERIDLVEPQQAVISFVQPEARAGATSAADVMAKFCHFIFLFVTRASGERWIAKHPGTFLYSLGDAFWLAKRLNASRFGSALAR